MLQVQPQLAASHGWLAAPVQTVDSWDDVDGLTIIVPDLQQQARTKRYLFEV